MTQLLFFHKHFTSEPNRLEEFFNHRKLEKGQVFLSKVDLYIAHVDEGAKEEFLSHLYSIPSYEHTYDLDGNLTPYTDKSKYQGMPWRKLRIWCDRFIGWFGWLIHMKKVPPAPKHSKLAPLMAMFGKRIPGQVFMLGEIPDHKREGTEDL